MESPDPDHFGVVNPSLRQLREGQLIAGRFRLVGQKPLGRGGMGIVWQALDERLNRGERALKFLADALAQDAMAVAELKEEVARCQELTFPHIVRVHDFVEDNAQGVAAISMELVHGGDVSIRRAQRRHRWFEPAEIEEWVRQLCDALIYAHEEKRVIHRDLKPANLLLDRNDRLKVADFGISAALTESVTRLTGYDRRGTPAYMSPEQAMGKRPTQADDLYAIGATLFDLLTGKPPFLGSLEVMAQQLRDPSVQAPSVSDRRKELRDVDAPIPALWEKCIASLLAKDARSRPATVRELREWLFHSPGNNVVPPTRPTLNHSAQLRAADSPALFDSPPPSVWPPWPFTMISTGKLVDLYSPLPPEEFARRVSTQIGQSLAVSTWSRPLRGSCDVFKLVLQLRDFSQRIAQLEAELTPEQGGTRVVGKFRLNLNQRAVPFIILLVIGTILFFLMIMSFLANILSKSSSWFFVDILFYAGVAAGAMHLRRCWLSKALPACLGRILNVLHRVAAARPGSAREVGKWIAD